MSLGRGFALIALVLALLPARAAAVTVVDFAASTYDAGNLPAMDAAHGVTGYTIESFEDVNLEPGLTVEFGSSPGVLVSTLAATHTTPYGTEWDGTRVIVNNPSNVQDSPQVSLTFHFATGMRSVGFGLGEMDRFDAGAGVEEQLFVNGSLVKSFNATDFPSFTKVLFNGGWMRHGYLRIDAAGAETISTVTITVNAVDTFHVDRLAFTQGVPEPASVALAAAAAALCLARARRRRD